MNANPFPVRAEQPSDYYVYGYFEPGSEQPFYIGKGRGRRAWCHMDTSRRTRKGGLFYARLRELTAKGITPDVRILHDELTDDTAKDKEIWLINRYGRIDIGTGCLCNHTRGGDGGVLSAEARAKIGRANRGKKRSAETRAKISQINRNRSPETRAKLSHAARNPSIETRERMSQAARNRSPDGRANSSRSRGGRPIESYDLVTDQRINYYTGAYAAADDGFDPKSVGRASKGHRKSYKGLGWRYV